MLSLRRTSALARLAGARSTTQTRQMSSQVRPRSRARAAPPAFHHRNINPKIPPSRRAQRSIRVSPELEAFVEQRVLPGTGVPAERFWSGLDSIVATLGPRNEALLRQRDALQAQIDGFHDATRPVSAEEQASFLRRIGYLQPSPAPYEIATKNVDAEVATVAGPQLVCPVENTRFILNAANARWGSLLDALYGTDALLGPPPKGGGYDARRGTAVWEETHRILDELFPLSGGKWREVTRLSVNEAEGSLDLVLGADNYGARSATNGVGAVGLQDGAQFVGYSRKDDGHTSLLFRKNGLHCEVVVDGRPKGERASRATAAGVVDVRLESATSAICDFEDSACTVDVDDKLKAYDNWLGLMRRDLSVGMVGKDGKPTTRSLNPPQAYTAAGKGGRDFSLPGQALLLARNVGMHMPTDIVTTADGAPIPEHFVDALVTVACALHDVRPGLGRKSPNASTPRNSRHGSVYIVKPKMHGPAEVALACELFDTVEDILGLPQNTVKLGVMDEERRTSLNLGRAMEVAKERLVFVNTGFLDRTADEIHTSMRAGAVAPKAAMKAAPWLGAYEKHNVAAALAHGLVGKGQIGKGMWAEPDNMKAMVATKGAQLDAGASTAWVPSPTAATLHALHYLRTSVADVQAALAAADGAGDYAAHHADILTAPIMAPKQRSELSAAEIADELDNNVQSLLGYTTRWVGQGVGCSKVPTIDGVQLMEDRATLRISSQLLANWLHHGVVSDADVLKSLHRIAPLVDEQNAADPSYQNLAPHFDGPEWHAAIELIWGGLTAPNGYTEPTLTKFRRERKALDAGTATARAAAAVAVAAEERAEQLRRVRNELERKGARLDLELKDAARDAAAEAAAASGGVLEPGPVVGAAWSRTFVDAETAPAPPPPRSRRDRLDSISVAP